MHIKWASLMAQMVKNLPAMQETWVWSLDQDYILEKGMATHSSILNWRIPCTKKSMWQRVRHDWAFTFHIWSLLLNLPKTVYLMGLPNQLPTKFPHRCQKQGCPVALTKILELSSPLLSLTPHIQSISKSSSCTFKTHTDSHRFSLCVCLTLWLLCPWDFPNKDTGVSCHFLLQGIFPTQRSNPGLLHCRLILYQLSYKESPIVSWFSPTSLLSPGSGPVSSLNSYFPTVPYSPLLTWQPERFW